MIDTDKYEGHTPAPWSWCEDEGLVGSRDDQCRTVIEEVRALNTNADAQLMANNTTSLSGSQAVESLAHCAMNFMSKHDLHFQFLNEHGVYSAPDGGSIHFVPYSYKWDDETKVSSESIQFTVRGEEE